MDRKKLIYSLDTFIQRLPTRAKCGGDGCARCFCVRRTVGVFLLWWMCTSTFGCYFRFAFFTHVMEVFPGITTSFATENSPSLVVYKRKEQPPCDAGMHLVFLSNWGDECAPHLWYVPQRLVLFLFWLHAFGCLTGYIVNDFGGHRKLPLVFLGWWMCNTFMICTPTFGAVFLLITRAVGRSSQGGILSRKILVFPRVANRVEIYQFFLPFFNGKQTKNK